MMGESISSIVIIASGILLGALASVFLIQIGWYGIFRIYPIIDKPAAQILAHVLTHIHKWQEEMKYKLRTDVYPESHKVVFFVLGGLYWLFFFVIWLSPIEMDWILFLYVYFGSVFATIGLFEISRLLTLRKLSVGKKSEK